MNTTPTIVIPGLASSARSCDALLRAAAPFGAATVADHRHDSSVEAMAERLIADAPRRFVLAGVSLGGAVALEVVRRVPERVRGLALICTTPVPDTEEEEPIRQFQLELVRAGRFHELFSYVLPTLLAANSQRDHDVLDLWASMGQEIGADVVATQLQAFAHRPDPRPVFPEIACPTVVIHGADDAIFPLEQAREMAEAIPTAQLCVIGNAGHAAPQQRPDAVGEAFTGLLQRAWTEVAA